MNPCLDPFAAPPWRSETLAANMDLIITVDTVIAHSPDGRWPREQEVSRWYPSLHLFRQTWRGHWATDIDAVAASLNAWSVRRS
jgi:hypothetical protein